MGYTEEEIINGSPYKLSLIPDVFMEIAEAHNHALTLVYVDKQD